jgi:hypothetical protein
VVVHGRAGGDALVCVHGADRVPEPGDRLEVAVDLPDPPFDAASGVRLEAGGSLPAPKSPPFPGSPGPKTLEISDTALTRA